ncbi:MAG: SusD/RagB family nutrient-binding outer membrane lipoprotein [Flavobacterium sp.]|nr:SusD/RagB family nutrient-binding outer membrane lipoprotein [Flavobacterium sp.]
MQNCTKDFEKVNIDPNSPTEVPAHLFLGNIIRVNQNAIYSTFVGGDMGLCWAQHWSKVQYNDEEKYLPRRGVIDGIWDALYADVISDAKSMYSIASAEGNTNLQGISLVLQANSFQILTDIYGPVPFTEVGQVGNLKPKFDSQEDVYNGIIDFLTQADQLLALNQGQVPATSDLLYGGNIAKWRKLANSLKLKALMRISNKVNVSSQVQALVTAGNLMSSNEDSAQLVYLAAQPDANPIYETIIFGNRAEYKNSSVFIDKLTLLNDPRRPIISQTNNAGQYVGNPPGVENISNYNGFSSPGTFYLSPTLPGVILSHAQVKFLLAEAANRGLISGGQTMAYNYYIEGIEASLKFNGVSQSNIDNYLAQPNINFTTQADGRVKIGEQNWIALYGQGVEAWTEWRRTGVPALLPAANAALPSIPKRYFYPTYLVNINKDNYLAATATLTGGDQLTSPIWWMN